MLLDKLKSSSGLADARFVAHSWPTARVSQCAIGATSKLTVASNAGSAGHMQLQSYPEERFWSQVAMAKPQW
eukprot:1150041-Amphidinium_carterae.1